jgi:hypothetical protein
MDVKILHLLTVVLFEIFTAMEIKVVIFRAVTCGNVIGYLAASIFRVWLEAARLFETLVSYGVHHYTTPTTTTCSSMTDRPIKWNSILLEKLTVAQLVKESPAIYGTRSFSTVFTRSRHWFLY